MSESNVVDMRGNAVKVDVGETPEAVRAVLQAGVVLSAERPYPVIGLVLVDQDGGAILRWENGGNALALVGALEALKAAVLKQIAG